MGWLSGSRRTLGKRMGESPRRFESCPHRLRIIFLNTWHSKIKENLYKFILKQSPKIDIFCLQEFDKEFFEEMEKKLKDFNSLYWTKKYINDWDFYQSMYIKDTFKFDDVSESFQAAIIRGKTSFLVCNIHGVSLPGHKNDSEERIEQSQTIINFAKKMKMPTVIGGDFNLNPDTKSIKMFEEAGFRNLIGEYGIKATRNHFAWDQAVQQQEEGGREFFGKQLFADYVFVSPGISVKNFEVPDIEISDHLPLVLDFEI